ncbi:MAG: DNA topoisomerase IV subunit A [Gemmatimonadota bacterium]|nr:DNA topoisomerase IV subunit A [Gemmatimonadota bacterium]
MAYVDTLYEKYYLEFASYSIKNRAIPGIDDGFKPVQRRILHALHEMDDGKYHKVANVVGQTMRYHPHGDLSIFGALVNLANKELFIDRQGNFGNIFTGDEASAARYIECRLTPLAREVLFNPETTEFEDSYDGRNREPLAFPAKIPVLLAIGSEGIAAGMTTRILPHNLIELLEAQIACLQDRPFRLHPDFPTGGMVDVSGYDDGNGKVLARAKLDTKDPKRIIVRELPFGTTTETLIASIEDASKKGKLKISGISDYTTDQVEIEIQLARGVHTRDTVDALYAFTDCETSIAANLLVIRENRPQITTVTDVIRYNTDRLVELLRTELKLEERRLTARHHAKTLEQIFIENRIYKSIEEETTSEDVYRAVFDGLEHFRENIRAEVTREDVDNLLKIPIRRISLYDINKAQEEMQEIRRRLREVRANLRGIQAYAIGFVEGIIEKYGADHPRKTEIASIQRVDVREAAQRNLKLRYDRNTGYLGHQVNGAAILDVSPYDRVLVIRKSGTYSVVDAPEKLFVDKGMLFCNFIDEDRVYNILYKENRTGYLYIKRCKIDKFILNRGYELAPEGCRILKLTTDSGRTVRALFKPKPRVRITEEEFNIGDYPVRGNRARGIRLANREVKSVKFI